jgi:hypothetical protein
MDEALLVDHTTCEKSGKTAMMAAHLYLSLIRTEEVETKFDPHVSTSAIFRTFEKIKTK